MKYYRLIAVFIICWVVCIIAIYCATVTICDKDKCVESSVTYPSKNVCFNMYEKVSEGKKDASELVLCQRYGFNLTDFKELRAKKILIAFYDEYSTALESQKDDILIKHATIVKNFK